MGTSKPEKVHAFILAAAILELLQDHEVDAGLSALNYCMATIIHQQLDGAEEALETSDQQTRFMASVLKTERHH